ncbi:hypothetical protein [Pseudalkalibacillus decolorationis]|uniref:hypothetical protein n=1 Tax=Pseudalkalibacillus decolorationis TaxID=163879 RepID=UPI00214831A8|nr:hypothetical protein [Pseudalkalibacillus decolorationis]
MFFALVGYISPLAIILLFFISSYFVMYSLAKILLMIFVSWIMILPFILLYKEEVVDYRKMIDQEKNQR